MRVMSISLGRRGGFPLYGIEMTRALSRICEVSALVSSGSDNIGEWRETGIPLMEVSTYSSNITGALSFFNAAKFARIKKFITAFRPDIIYYPGDHYWKPVLDILISRKTPIVMTVHDPTAHPGDMSLPSLIITALNWRKPDAFVLLNESQARDFELKNRVPQDKLIILPHGIFSNYVKSSSELEDFSDFEPLVNQRGRYFLFLGRIVRYKGIETLIDAFGALLNKTDRPLVIAGSGNFSGAEAEKIARIPADRISVFNRWLSDPELATLMANAYMTVLPYEGATQSGVIAASAAFGTPSVVSDSGGLKEQITDGETGFVFAAGNVTELAATLLKASQIPREAYEEMRKLSLRKAMAEWSWDVLASRLADFLARQIPKSG